MTSGLRDSSLRYRRTKVREFFFFFWSYVYVCVCVCLALRVNTIIQERELEERSSVYEIHIKKKDYMFTIFWLFMPLKLEHY